MADRIPSARRYPRGFLFWGVSLIALIVVLCGSLLIGRFALVPSQVWEALTGSSTDLRAMNVVLQIRLPRIVLAALVGLGLAVSGTAYQGVFQNPLVSPDVLAVSSGAAFGAVVSIMIGGNSTVLTIMALSAGLISVALTYNFSRVRGRTTVLSLVLSGMVMSALFNALISIMKYTADTETQLPEITYWLMGTFAGATVAELSVAAGPIVISAICLFALAHRINILSLGDEEAQSLGINPAASRRLVIFFATLATAACITVTGVIGWVGLVIPHIARLIVGPNHSRLLPASAILGAIFLSIMDIVARSITASEIPIGTLTAIIGAPFFLILLHRQGGMKL